MAQPSYVAVPAEALRRRHELSSGAWDLYQLYLKHYNRDTGQCDPSNELLAELMECTYTHVSDCKRELILGGWIRRAGRRQVELLVGALPAPKVVPLEQAARPRSSENSEDEVRKIPNLGESKFGKFRSSSSENSELGSATPIYEPSKEPVAAATAAAAVDSSAVQDPMSAEVTEDFVAGVIADGLYPELHVRYVWHKLRLRCKAEATQPSVRRFLYWLSTERATPQQELPGMGAQVSDVTARFAGVAAPAKKRCDSTCPLCFGTGYEVVAGKGARRCTNMTDAQSPAEGEGLKASEG